MASRIQTHARGLLGLLDAKTGGVTPTLLADAVQMQLDTFPFYLAQRRETISSNTAAVAADGAIFFTAGFSVPQDEIWYVAAFSIAVNSALIATEFMGFIPIHRSQNVAGNTADVHLAAGLVAGSTVGTRPETCAQAPFWAIAGDQLGAFMYHRAVYTGTLRGDAMILRIRI